MVRLQIDGKEGPSSIRISFTDQRLTAHGGMIVWTHFLQQKKFRSELKKLLPHAPTSPNSYRPDDTALGYLGGILAGADKLSRVAWLQSDPAIAEVLGVEAIVSQPTLSRFFAAFTQKSATALGALVYSRATSIGSVAESPFALKKDPRFSELARSTLRIIEIADEHFFPGLIAPADV